MSRIRSIHPGIWTDEVFVSLSAFARLMFIGIWTEADDKGCFPWSPLQMKMRVLPGDNADAPQLMDELAEADCIRRYEVAGKSYGAVRNFMKFQRPKKPNDIHPASAEALRFVGMDEESIKAKASLVPNQFPTSGEKPPQMEDGGEDEGGSSVADATGAAAPLTALDVQKVVFDTGRMILKAAGHDDRAAGSILGRLRKTYSDSQVLIALSRCQVEQPSDPVGWLTKTLQSEARYGERPANNISDPFVRAALGRQAERAAAQH